MKHSFFQKIGYYLLAFTMLLTTTACNNGQEKQPVSGNSLLIKEDNDETVIISHATPLPKRSFFEPYSVADITSYSNQKYSWGYSSKSKDAYGRPNASVAAQEQYGNLGAEFLRENCKTIYLTFDEGYEYGCTGAILDTLQEKDVSAVFFVTMPYVKSEPDLVRRMIDEGHVVASHSVSHPAKGMPSLSIQKQEEEMRTLHNYILENFQYEMYLFRYPAGIYSEQSLALMKALGYRCVFWSFAYQDWLTDKQPTPDYALKKMIDQLHNGAIYLLHAVSTTNTQVLGTFIDAARDEGYEFGYYN